MRRFLSYLVFTLCCVIASKAVTYEQFFSVDNPIKFNDTNYYFAWSAHPQKIYYIQEYLPKGETLEHYNSMISISVVFWDKEPNDLIHAKISEIEQRKETDPVANYSTFEKDGAYILDFLVSEGDEEGLDVVEWDLHYYQKIKIDGKNATLLTFYSKRAYDDDILPFIKAIPSLRGKMFDAIIGLKLDPKFNK